MKKWMKGILIAGVGLLLAGTGITAIAAVAGGLRGGNLIAGNWIERHLNHDTLEHISDRLGLPRGGSGDTENMRKIESVLKENMALAGSYEDVENLHKLELKAERMAVRFEEREEAAGGILIYVKKDPALTSDLEWDSRDGKLEIHLSYQKTGSGYGQAVVEVPAGCRFSELELESDAGYMKIRNARADKLTLEARAADLSVDQFTAGKLELSSEAGNLTASGEIEHTAEVEAEAGAVSLSLTGNESEYGYEVKNAVGSVRIGENSYYGITRSSQAAHHREDWDHDGQGWDHDGEGWNRNGEEWNNNGENWTDGQPARGGNSQAEKRIEVDCSVGSVEIRFTGETD